MLVTIKNFRFTLLLTVLSLTFVLTGLSCGSSDTSNETQNTTPTTETPAATPVTDLSTIDPTTINTSFTNNQTNAKTKAVEWKIDAKLYSFSVKLPPDLALNNATDTFVFGSPADNNNWWVYSVSENTGKFLRALIPKADYLGNTLNPINDKYWKSNYLQAFQKADIYQGATFRAANPNSEISVTLANGEPKGWLWWTVEYKSSTGNTLKIRINPNDLTIVDDLGNIVTTGSSTSTTQTQGTTSGNSTTSGTTSTTPASNTQGTSSTQTNPTP